MLKSESIAQLADALSKAQAEMESAKKDSDNPFFKSKYADLASVWDACRGPLTRHGLSVIQTPETDFERGGIALTTLLLHSSGEWISSELVMKPVDEKPQTAGSCITYMRRYSLSAAVGIAPEDDDGNQASGKSSKITEAPRTIAAPSKIVRMEKPIDPVGGGPTASGESLSNLAEGQHDSKATPILSMDELSDIHQQNKFAAEYRKALPEKFRPHAEQLRHAALEDEGYKSSKDILKKDFQRVANKIIKTAALMKEPYIATDEDLPVNI